MRYPFAHLRNVQELPLTVFREDSACFLEALVGHLFKGDIVGGKEGDAAAAGANGADASLEELALFARGGHGVWVEPWKGWGRGGGCWSENFVFLLGAGCEALAIAFGYRPRWMTQAAKCWANGIKCCRHAQRLQKDLKMQGDLRN